MKSRGVASRKTSSLNAGLLDPQNTATDATGTAAVAAVVQEAEDESPNVTFTATVTIGALVDAAGLCAMTRRVARPGTAPIKEAAEVAAIAEIAAMAETIETMGATNGVTRMNAQPEDFLSRMLP